MSTKNIYTGVVVMLALVMLLVALFATGVIGKKDEEPESSATSTELQTFIVTKIEVESQTNEFGDVTFYTVLDYYVQLGVSSDHTYKTTTTLPTTTENPFVEQDSFVYATNADGSPVYGEDGKPVTEVVKVTVDKNSLTTLPPPEPETRVEQVTDENGVAVTDENGQPVTESYTVEYTTAPVQTTADRWAEETKDNGRFPNIEVNVGYDDELANDIIEQINSDRASVGGREALATELNGVARADSSYSSMPIYQDRVSGRGMAFVTTYGGSRLYADIARAMSGKIHSDSSTKIGVGVSRSGDKYYTVVIIE